MPTPIGSTDAGYPTMRGEIQNLCQGFRASQIAPSPPVREPRDSGIKAAARHQRWWAASAHVNQFFAQVLPTLTSWGTNFTAPDLERPPSSIAPHRKRSSSDCSLPRMGQIMHIIGYLSHWLNFCLSNAFPHSSPPRPIPRCPKPLPTTPRIQDRTSARVLTVSSSNT